MLTVPARYRTNGNAEYILKNHPVSLIISRSDSRLWLTLTQEFRNDDTELVVTFAVNGPNNDCDLWTYVPRFFRIKMTTPNPGIGLYSRRVHE